jgi:hypothetical protein
MQVSFHKGAIFSTPSHLTYTLHPGLIPHRGDFQHLTSSPIHVIHVTSKSQFHKGRELAPILSPTHVPSMSHSKKGRVLAPHLLFLTRSFQVSFQEGVSFSTPSYLPYKYHIIPSCPHLYSVTCHADQSWGVLSRLETA